MAEKKPRLRFRLAPRETGLRAVCAGPRGHYLMYGDERLATVYRRREHGDFYWAVPSNAARGLPLHNTLAHGDPGAKTWPTLAAAKDACFDFVNLRLRRDP